MRIVSLTLEGYRRFTHARANFDAPVVAVIGPNQAGKSSLLDALLRLHDSNRFDERDRNRSNPPSDDTRILTALFRIESIDRKALAGIPGAESVRFLALYRYADGRRTFQTDPPLLRPKRTRLRAIRLLRKALASRWIRDVGAPDEEAEAEESSQSSSDMCRSVADRLDSSGDSVEEETLSAAVEIMQRLKGGKPRSDRALLAATLSQLVSDERSEHPHQTALNALSPRVPAIARFSDEERELLPDYDLADSSTWNQAARNLTALAGTSMEELASVTADGAKRKTVLDPANATLASYFAEYWTQAPINVALEVVQDRLEVVTERRPGQWSSIGESSDGMRAFVALLAFARRFASDPRPVFLVDEAERHLHYDAQADLVRVFESQTAAAQIVFTTHSLGCLPQDLGRGLRAIEQVPDTDESRVINSVWDLGKGIDPIARAIGASALAFVAARYAVFAEGGTEATLLPTLLREANGLDRLEYQVLPGLAEASQSAISLVSLDAVHLVYLVDGDNAGQQKETYLVRRGVDRDRIKVLGRRWSGATTEDVVARAKYVDAVDAELTDRHGTRLDDRSKVPDVGRAAWVDGWCKKRGLSVSHPAVAARLLDAEGPLVQSNRRSWLQRLHLELESALGIGVSAP